ncbi:hypothetical protein GCM10027413_21130 [Conyzicola nivalis]|uniref:Uncharacterized protein n=1 Tax=Conyzicola nivalis TaxID=1477021 RepID=A0A916SER7_9MICO|nr:hypothetical protein [Conyzicola nivalis]GGA93848.1 hypothetical protein GCM10010979_05490 [Conyzicola nivalis]
MSDSTYTAQLVGSDGTESIELEFIGGLPQKSFVRPVSGDNEGEEMLWELVDGGEGSENASEFEYRQAGWPGADYS